MGTSLLGVGWLPLAQKNSGQQKLSGNPLNKFEAF